MRWDQGRAEIERLLAVHELQQVPASREHADRLMSQARTHLISAATLCETDPEGAYALAYDAARKALTAVLENQGLRPTSAGGHLVVYQAARAQLNPPLGDALRPFDRMRRRRRDAEYPSTEVPELAADDVREDIPKANAIVELAARVLDQMSPF